MRVLDGEVRAQVLDRMRFVNHEQRRPFEVENAITDAPTISNTITGGSTVEVTLADADRKLVRSKLVETRSWLVVDGRRYELVGIGKAADRVTLTYEDSIVAKLRRMTSPRSFPANTLSRAQIARRLADEAGIKVDTDPGHKENVHSVIERSSRGEEKTNSWDLLGSDIADPIQWRRFSDGKQLVVGSDDWLFKRSTATRVEENRGPYGYVDFDLDVGRRVSEATLTVDAHLWSLPPGAPVKLSDLGPADGNWLVAEFAADLVSSRGTVKLIRKRHELKEPPPVSTKGERGEDDFLPGKGEGTDAGGSTGSAARDRMVNWALAQKGKPYVWGASGPGAFDCSGLVQEACRAAGKVLPKPSASQWAAVVNAGRTMSVASAINTRGALLFRIGTGTYNHVVISLGNGQTIEAMGSAYGVCIGGTAGRGWTGAGTWV